MRHFVCPFIRHDHRIQEASGSDSLIWSEEIPYSASIPTVVAVGRLSGATVILISHQHRETMVEPWPNYAAEDRLVEIRLERPADQTRQLRTEQRGKRNVDDLALRNGVGDVDGLDALLGVARTLERAR